jgi:outer membrane protein assembly factor BamB/predicted phosphodiesterase
MSQPITPIPGVLFITWLLCVVLSTPGYTAVPSTYYSQWGTPVCDDTVTDRSQPIITISGTVYADRNDNGTREDGEDGLPDVGVSDGVQVVRTGAAGGYTLTDVQPGVQRTVFVIVPTGYRIGGAFYRCIPGQCAGMTADFGLAPDPASTAANHAFIHVTDSHITRPGATCFAEMAALPASFIVASGDLTNNRELDAFRDAVSRATVPVMALPGNHDVLVNGSGALAGPLGSDATYEALIGPKYYAFNYGGRHYVLLNSIEDMPRQMAWLKNDLAMLPAKTELLIFQHFPPTSAQMALYQQYNTRAIFSGHTHANRVMQVGKILYVTTPPLLGGGLDLNPRSYRLVTFTDGQITLDSLAIGYGSQRTFPAPPVGAADPKPAIRLRADWPMFKGNPARTGSASDTLKPPCAVSWTQALGGTIHLGSPVVGHGMVYLGVGDDSGAQRSGVYALDALTRQVRWHYPTAAKVAHAQCLVGDLVLATSNDGIVHAIDAATGARRWSYSLGSPMDCWLYTSPVVADGRVFCGTADHFTALELATGTPLWRMPSASAGHWPTYSSPAYSDGKVVCAFPGPGVFTCDAKTGARGWQAEKSIAIASNSAATTAISGKTVYTRTGSALFALDFDTGVERWHYNNKGGAPSPVVTETGVVLAMGNGTVVKLDTATGKEVWSYSAAPLRKGGKPKWYFDPLLIATPLVAGSVVYLCTTDGHLVALDESTGTELAVMEMGRPFTASPAVSGNTFFLAAYDGTVFAVTSTAPQTP